jgi:quercetin dioxygenase-like cupin family protein
MSKAGDVVENPVTGERVVVRIGTGETRGELLVVDLYIRPGGAVVGEHYHPVIEERFTVLRGQVGYLGYRLSGKVGTAGPGVALFVPAGVPHEWWNAGPEGTLVRVEVWPAARFEAMIQNVFGLAQDGKVNRRGMPNFLQLAVFAREFDDVVRFTRPPRVVQRLLFGLLAPIARLLGYRGSYPEYLARGPSGFVPVEPLDVAAAPAGRPASLST